MMKINDIPSALKEFEMAAIKHAEATETGDYKNANKNYTVITKSIKYLREQSALNDLIPFMTSSNIGVRLWAATYLLLMNLKEAESTLEAIAQINGIHSLDAKTVLSEWKKGNLRL